MTTDGTVSFIEYSSSSGTKRGYIENYKLNNRHDGILGIVTASSTSVYCGTDTTFYRVGSIGRTEYAVLLKDNGTWAFVEYNTPSGRKRGYTLLSNITNHNSTSAIPGIYVSRDLGIATDELNAYCGPNEYSAKLGTVFNGDQVNIIDENEYGWCFVEYYTGNHASKRGYVNIHKIQDISLSSIPAPSGGSLITYGMSAERKSLNAYKLGTGSNVLFAVFAQHGFEDGWAADGIELVKVANNLISDLKGNGNLSKWTIYVIPSANPDGLLDGYTNNGYGRCTYYGYDMNRSHNTSPLANFSDSRNLTNNNSSEVLAFENFIGSYKSSNGQNVLLDVHGWEGSTLGDPTISKYFGNALGLRHVSDGGSNGYLIKWGAQNNIASVLVEFPLTANAAALANLNVSGKFNSAIKNLLENTGYNSGSTSSVEGYLDEVNKDCIRGWARDDNNKADTIFVDTYIKNSSGDNVYSERVTANNYRSDVAPGSHGFSFAMDWRPFVPGTYKVYSYGIGKNGNNPMLGTCPKTFVVGRSGGFVDKISEDGIRGWVWKPASPNLPIKVKICINNSNGDTIWSSTVNADQYRGDLYDLGYGNGYHGFSILLPWENIENGRLSVIAYAIDGSGSNPVIYNNSFNNTFISLSTLKSSLSKLREKLGEVTKIKAVYTSDKAVDIIMENYDYIVSVSNELSVPKESIESILYRELICYGQDDIVADIAVKNGLKDDSSTGICQIFAKTAIIASNKILGTSYNKDDKTDLKNMWDKLQDDHQNIYYAGIVLLYKASLDNITLDKATRSQMQKVFTYYNGDASYGKATIEYYDLFLRYLRRK